MNDEESARSEPMQNWNTYPADAKTRCVGQTMDGGTPSYVKVVECIVVTVNKALVGAHPSSVPTSTALRTKPAHH
jgi:hypothetical protein